MHPFESSLMISAENLASDFLAYEHVAWADFELNPRRLRGSDFLMRWSQGVWSEKRIVQAVANEGSFFALPYGPSGTAPDGDPRAYELYFERLEKAGKSGIKRPDLLLFSSDVEKLVSQLVNELGGNQELPFVTEHDERMQRLIQNAVVAIECENSLWKARQMPGFGAVFSPQKRLDGQLGLKKTAIVPTIILKEEDRQPLKAWERDNRRVAQPYVSIL